MLTTADRATVEMSATDYELRKKLGNFIQASRQIVIGRDKQVGLIAIAWVARANLLLLGDPGEGKSFLSHLMINNVLGKSFFAQCSPETDMDAIFGTPIFSELQQGKMVRNLDGSLAGADLAFIDEIGKANDTLHKSMFTALNERIFANGTSGIVNLPLVSTISASNEPLSSETAGLNSRFHLKSICNRLDNKQRFELLSRRNKNQRFIFPDEYKLTIEDIRKANEYMRNIRLPDSMIDNIISIGNVLDLTSSPDSRKLEICVDLIKTSCWLRMKTEPTIQDLSVLKYALWDAPEHTSDVEEVIEEFIKTSAKK